MSARKHSNPSSMNMSDHFSLGLDIHKAHKNPAAFKPINVEDDFFSKSAEFRFWLKEEKHKFMDQMDSDKAKAYFSKFARHWNKGKLNPKYYELPEHLRASAASSSHSWSFSGLSALDKEKIQVARQEAIIGPHIAASSSQAQKPLIGPTLPPLASSSSITLGELQYNKDVEGESIQLDIARKKAERKRKRTEDREDDRDNRATGKDRLVEKRREKRNGNVSYQQEREDRTAVDLDDHSVFGSDSSFQAAIAARDRAAAGRSNRNANNKQEKHIIIQEKMAVMKSKEASTMTMLKALAASKYGPSA